MKEGVVGAVSAKGQEGSGAALPEILKKNGAKSFVLGCSRCLRSTNMSMHARICVPNTTGDQKS